MKRASAPAAKPPRLAAIRKIALSFPQAWENEWYGDPWFQVGKSSFALYSSKEGAWIFKLPQAHQMVLFESRPDTFWPMRAGRLLWSFVRVEDLDSGELRARLESAWRMIAPKKVQRAYDEVRSTK
ncbi:MAG TPA: hypothetical protein VHL34_08125 [Rhizomicrobium sp.]|jgi:hypothetical protein|nr:hypothetical protein [Rhizomicrobium sp.]